MGIDETGGDMQPRGIDGLYGLLGNLMRHEDNPTL